MPYKDPARARERARSYYYEHREKLLRASAEWRKLNPERAKELRRMSHVRNPELGRENRKRYRARHPEQIKAQRQAQRQKDSYKLTTRGYHLRRTYGITDLIWDALLEMQGGGCAICGNNKKKLVVDHDHQSGRIRGLLCQSCNIGLAKFRDDRALLGDALSYLISH